ncbi:MAG: LuxR C-terminal-related transcriptional regulator [Verrucomicrobiales bacterium]|nr:LuxR C-terminal-related transcriptional regulator [Verrucomicrobiales bacterium]
MSLLFWVWIDMADVENSSLTEEDVCQLVALLGRVAVLEGGLDSKKRFLMQGLCQMVGADCWGWMLTLPVKHGEKVCPAAFLHGGFSEDRFYAFLKATEHPEMAKFNAMFLDEVYVRQSHTTRLRQQVDTEGNFTSSEVYPLWEKADIGPILLSCHPFPDQSLSFVAMYRKQKEVLFSQREARIVHIVLSEVQWIHAESQPQVKQINGMMLSPRQRMTLNLLLEGQGRKQIAAQLKITENTLAGYVKEVYRFYEVQSQAQLMRRFRDGDGGDDPSI